MTTAISPSQPLAAFSEKLEATILSHQRQKSASSSMQRRRKKPSIIPVGLSNPLDKQNIATIIGNLDHYLFDDVMLLVWCERTAFYKSEPTSNSDQSVTRVFFRHWIQLYLKQPNQVLSVHLSTIPKYGGWGDLWTIYTCAHQMESTIAIEMTLLKELKQACVKMLGDQLESDYRVMLKQLDEEKMGIKSQDRVSNCATEAPRISNNHKKSTTIMAKEIAQYLYSTATKVTHNEQSLNTWKGDAYESYRCLISAVCQMLKAVSPISVNGQIRSSAGKDRPLFCTREQRVKLLSAPFSSHIIHPQPQPVVPRSLEEFEPLFEHLVWNKPGPSDDNQPIVFPRGTIMSGGRLDLCKQVVGPQGVQPLLNVMKHSSYVSRLLLGNNIVGLSGAQAISQYIRSHPDSNIDTWYIACNRFDSEGILLICDALATDTKVKALWLKRNPILAAGAVHIARMLTSNTYLQTLDLLNTGLLDEGCAILFNALKANHRLKHLYIDTNGLTIKSGHTVRLYFEGSDNHLETLSLSCNVLSDAGTCELAAGLKHDTRLKQLSLASNSIGPNGARALVDALLDHPALEQLNLGLMKATTSLGGLNNTLGDEGAAEISRLLQFNNQIRSIDLTCNDVSLRGVTQLRDALEANRTLTTLKGLQFKHMRNKTIQREIKARIEANQIEWGRRVLNSDTDDASLLTESEYLKKGQELTQEINFPEHMMEVISHYRTQ